MRIENQHGFGEAGFSSTNLLEFFEDVHKHADKGNRVDTG